MCFSNQKMERAESSTTKIDQIKKDIHQLLHSKQLTTSTSGSHDHQHQLLLNLVSQLESLTEAEHADQSHPAVQTKEAASGTSESETKNKDEYETSNNDTGVEAEAEAVVKQLKILEKQNRITHWLLSALIVLTLAWQVSEVSLLLKLKEGFTHPLKSVGNMVAGLIKRPRPKDEEAKVNGSMDVSGLVNNSEEQ